MKRYIAYNGTGEGLAGVHDEHPTDSLTVTIGMVSDGDRLGDVLFHSYQLGIS